MLLALEMREIIEELTAVNLALVVLVVFIRVLWFVLSSPDSGGFDA